MRISTEKIYQKKANQVIDYVSANLHKSLQLKVIADSINLSERQLFRIMKTFLDEPLSAYIMRQRMERAVMIMQTEELHLVNVANMVGYDNEQSFSKSFKKQFGISPKEYSKKLKSQLKRDIISYTAIPNLIDSQTIDAETIELVYLRVFGKYGDENSYKNAWTKLIAFMKSQDVLSKHTRFIGISFDDPNITSNENCRFYVCASIDKSVDLPGEFGNLQLVKGRYAVYTLKGSYSQLQNFYNKISVKSEYVLRHGILFEEYLNNPQTTHEEELLTKVFIPIL